MNSQTVKKIRRHDIDWIRVIVFDLLIIYHVGMFFVPWGWHIKNDVIVDWMKWPMLFVNQWRLPILFVVSGMGTRFALSHRTGGEYIRERFKRLFIPLIVGILIVIAPQVYIERLSQGTFSGTFIEFYPHFFEGIYPKGNFSWHHLWFLPYLLLMSIVATPLFLYLRKENKLIRELKKRIEKSSLYLYLFVVPLFFIEAFLEPLFPINHALVGDWYALAFYFILFLSGFILIALRETFWMAVRNVKNYAMFTGMICLPILIWFWLNVESSVFIPLLKTINIWSWILAIIGYSSKYLNRDSAIIRYRNQAVYPFYILHQTITVLLGYWLMNHPMHYALKFGIMIIGTFGISWLLYEFPIKRMKIIRPLFGLKNRITK